MVITIGKKEIKLDIANDIAIRKAIENETMCEVIYEKWIDDETMYYTCGGDSIFGYKLISGVVKVRK